MIGAIAISIAAIVISGHFGLPYLAMISPDPAISGYIGYYAGIIALGIIPLILLVKTAINFIGGYRSTVRFKRALSGIWVVSFIIFILTGFFTVRNFIHEERVTELVSEDSIDPDQPLQINLNGHEAHNPRIQFSSSAFLSNGRLYNRDGVNVKIKPSTNDKLKITKTESSRGMNKIAALRNRYYAKHKMAHEGNQIQLDEFYTIEKRDKFRAQHLRYDIEVPIGTTIYVNKRSPIFSNREIRLRHSSNQWIMTEEGLQQVQES